MIVLVAILFLLVGLVVSHHYIVVPCWETEAKLRKELGKVRGELWARTLEVSNLKCWMVLTQNFTPAIKTRTHSDVLPFDSIDDLIEATKK